MNMSATDIREMRQPKTPVTTTARRRADDETSRVTRETLTPLPMRHSRAAVYERRARSRLPSRAVARGVFITFEGIEGSGKSTQMRRAAALLAERGIPHLATREPGGTPLGQKLRTILLDTPGHLDAAVELLLLVADRRQHLVEEIQPALARGVVVMSDRFTDASRAYQGAGRRLGEARVDALHELFAIPEPDRTYLFDCPVATGLSRIASRDKAADRIDQESAAFHRRVRLAYRRRAASEPARFRVIDASPSEDEVFAALAKDLLAFVARRRRRSA
jgi:dTMP kinase